MNGRGKVLELELSVIKEISQGIAGFIDLDQVIDQVLKKLVQTLGYSLSGLMLLDKEKKYISLKQVELPKHMVSVMNLGLGFSIFDVKLYPDNEIHRKNFCLRPFVENQVVMSKNFAEFSYGFINKGIADTIQKVLGIKLLVGLPISIKGMPFGTLIVGTKNETIVTQAVDVLETFANQISIAIYNAQLFSRVQNQVEKLTQQSNDLSSMHDLSVQASSTKQKEKAVQELLDVVPRKMGHVGVSAAGILLVTETDQLKSFGFTKRELVDKALTIFMHKKAYEDLYKPVDIPAVFKKVLATQQVMTLNSLSEAFPEYISPRVNKAISKLMNTNFYALAPIIQSGHPIGIVVFSFSIPIDKFEDRHREILRVFTNHVGIAMENADLYDQLQKQLTQVEHQRQALSAANQKLKALDRAKSEFISIASHQLRTPLTVIKGYTSMILEGSLGQCDDQALTNIKKVLTSTDRLVALVNDLLDISRIEKGKLIYQKTETRIEDVVSSVFEELEKSAHDKGLTYALKLSKNQTPMLLVDPQKMRQVFLNLIDNAIKYTKEGGITISVKADARNVLFECRDTGLGMTEEEIKNLFEKFQRGGDVSVLNTEGVGLGLFVARKIVEAHGGIISATSDGRNKGSRFVVSLPIPNGNGK